MSIYGIMNYNEDTDNKAYLLEVDLDYTNYYSLACERYQPKRDNCYKLCGIFHDKKDYIDHIQNLQLYLKLGLWQKN